MRVVFAGTPEFAVPALRALAGSDHELVGVLTQPDRPAGRGQRLRVSAVKAEALTLGVALAQPQTLRTDAGRAALSAWRPDLLVVVAYGLLLPPEALAIPRLGCVNVHASLLPRWRGAAPIQRAILAGDETTGVTIMQMDAGLDTGPTLRSCRFAVGERMTSGELHAALATLGAQVLLQVLPDIAARSARAQPQPQQGVTQAARISKREALVDWSRGAVELARQVRAFNPWPVAETRFAGEQLRLYRAHAELPAQDDAPAQNSAVRAASPGTVLGLGADGALRVACGAGVLAVEQLQRQGRGVVTAREFANGRDVIGAQLG